MKYSKPLVIVDVETTGMSPARSRVIEIACIRLENGVETDRFVTLVDPDQGYGRQIEAITGITEDMVKGAPTFAQIADRVDEIFRDATLCAHNARFDYGFIKAEMLRAGYAFKKQILCTAKLSRSLFPQYRKHDLSSVIERFGFDCAARHRAEGDADVLVQFLAYINSDRSEDEMDCVLGTATGSTCIPAQLDKKIVDELPECPGVYTFYGEDGEILYIGKSINIRSRVMSHFSNTHRDGKEMKLWQEVHDIGYETTVSDLGASLLELAKIKTEYPKYNRMSRKVQSLWYLKKTDARTNKNNKMGTEAVDHLSFALVPDSTISPDDFDDIYAVFKTKSRATKTLREIAKEHSFCPKLMGAESGSGACFSSQLGLCSGACCGKIPADEYNQHVDDVFADRRLRVWPYGKKMTLRFYDEDTNKTEVFVVDNWMLERAYVSETDEPRPFLELGPVSHLFDYDVYKVLARHLLKGKAH